MKKLVSLLGLFLIAALALPEDDKKDEIFRQVERAVRHGHSCPVLADAEGNAPAGEPDLTRVWVANDAQNIYFLLEFAAPVASTPDFHFVSVKLNTDFDQTTGCNVGVPALSGHEYEILLGLPGRSSGLHRRRSHLLLLAGRLSRRLEGLDARPICRSDRHPQCLPGLSPGLPHPGRRPCTIPTTWPSTTSSSPPEGPSGAVLRPRAVPGGQ